MCISIAEKNREDVLDVVDAREIVQHVRKNSTFFRTCWILLVFKRIVC